MQTETDPPTVLDEAPAHDPAGRGRVGRVIGRALETARRHAIAVLLFAAGTVYVMHGLIFHPGSRVVGQDTSDQAIFEWMLAAVAHQVAHLHNPLFSPAGDAPYGVNLMANPSVVGYGVLFSPLTLAVGAAAVLVFLLAFNLFATAVAWYWFFLRYPAPDAETGLQPRRAVAVLGAAVCAYSPAMIAHSYAHPNLTGQWLVPLIADRVFRICRGRDLRSGAILGLLVSLEISISEELVLITALALGLIVLVHVISHPRRSLALAPAFAYGIGAAGAVAAPLLAYPLWFQFRGPRSFTGSPWQPANYEANLASYLHYSPLSIAGDAADATRLAPNITEATAFVGIPLLVLVLALVVWRRSDPAIRAVAATALVLVVLSLGPVPTYGSRVIGHAHAPWNLIGGLPGFVDALPVRVSLGVFPLLAYILVAGLLHIRSRPRKVAWAAYAVLAAALVPALPLPLSTQPRPTVPAFYADGLWRQCVPPGGTLLSFPLDATAMRWSTAADLGFNIVGGTFFGPAEGTRAYGPVSPRATGFLLDETDQTGKVPPVTASVRAQVAADIAFWHADCVALQSVEQPMAATANLAPTGLPLEHPAADRELLDELFGPGKRIGGVWTWSTRGR